MVVQILINWDDILSSIDMSHDTIECGQFTQLAQLIKQNGCLIKSHYTEFSLAKWYTKGKLSHRWKLVLDVFINNLYHDFGLKVDHGQNATSFDDTVKWWNCYLQTTGIKFAHGDGRCVILSKTEKEDGVFFKSDTLSRYTNDAENQSWKWSRLQHFSNSNKDVARFKAYMESFTATAKDFIRIYDPYLSSAFMPIRGKHADTIRAWHNSFQFLMSVLLSNNNIQTYDIITSFTRDINDYLHERPTVNKLLIQQVVRDYFVTNRKTPAKISFHFLTSPKGSEFHDRFLVNGRFCFAIGHGCDVCRGDYDFQAEHTRLSSFNVFYGCSSKSYPSGLSVFCQKNDNSEGNPMMFPLGCSARPFNTIMSFFEMDATGNSVTKNEILVPCGQNDLTIRVNPLTVKNVFQG